MENIKELQDHVAQVFDSAFGRTPLRLRLEDIEREQRELSRYTDLRNLREETGDLLCSLIQLCNESGWSLAEVINLTLAKIESRKLQYASLGRKISVAVMGGSFDPITVGHIDAARFVLNTSRQFDELWLCPCYAHMDNKRLTDASHRLAMCEIAARVDARIRISSYEIENKLRGDTYHFVQKLTSDVALSNNQFSWIAGLDVANRMPSWPSFQDLERIIRIVVVPRPGYELDADNPWYLKPPHLYLRPDDHFRLRETNSTEARKLLVAGDPLVRDKLDPAVLDYIHKNGLYGIKT